MELVIETAVRPLGIEKISDHPDQRIREFGKASLKLIMLDAIAELPQVRTGENQAFPDLMASISRDGLNNPPDVAILNTEQFAEVIELNNDVWNRGIELDDFKEYRLEIDGDNEEDKKYKYCVAIAGHTRLAVLRRLQRLAQSEDPNEHTAVWCKVHEICEPKEFYRRQLSENFHHAPGKEEQAVAIYRTYMSGLASGQWRDEDEFGRWSGIGRKTINEAIAFSRLPQKIIDDVLGSKLNGIRKNPLTFNMAVELGKGADTLIKYASRPFGERPADLKSEEGKKYLQAVSEQYQTSITIIANGIWNGNKNKGQNSLAYIREEIRKIQNQLEPTTGSQLTIDDLLGSPESQTEMYRVKAEKELEKSVRRASILLDVEIPRIQRLARMAMETPGDSSKITGLIERMTNQSRQLEMWSVDNSGYE